MSCTAGLAAAHGAAAPQPKRPTPSLTYLSRVNHVFATPTSPRALLIVLDLNGTLLHRQKTLSPAVFTRRPRVNDFLAYLFANHSVMVWASAEMSNVDAMCTELFTPEQHARLVAVWARGKLGLPRHLYNRRVRVFKRLSQIWKDGLLQRSRTSLEEWDQTNTLLIDDNADKAASEPFNVVEIARFELRPDADPQDEDCELQRVQAYLEKARWTGNVSNFVRSHPYAHRRWEDVKS